MNTINSLLKTSDNVALQAVQTAKSQKRNDLFFISAAILILSFSIVVLIWLIADMFISGWHRLGYDFLSSFPSRHASKAGILSAWVGSLLVLLVTAFAAVPIGIASGIYLEEYAKKNWFSKIIETNIINLASVPSIIYGLLALGIFVHTFRLGASIQTAGLTLALLILPIIIVTTREALRTVPLTIREGAYGCGATRWQLIQDHLLPYSMPNIMTGIIIGLARAIGETAPIITIGALTFISFLPEAPFQNGAGLFTWLESPFTVMPIQIFNWTSRPSADFHANAAAAGLILIVMTLSMNGLAIYLRYRLRKNMR